MIEVCAHCGQTGRNADKIPRHTSKVNYVHMVLHCAMLPNDFEYTSVIPHSQNNLNQFLTESKQ